MQSFSGGVNEWENFQFYFQNIAHEYKWKERKRLQCLMECLQGEANEYVRTLPLTTMTSYRQLMKALQKRFGKGEEPHIQNNIFDLQQETSESLDAYAERVLQYVGIVFRDASKKTRDSAGTDVFLKGVDDKIVSSHVAQMKPKNVQQALEWMKQSSALADVIRQSYSSPARVSDQSIPQVKEQSLHPQPDDPDFSSTSIHSTEKISYGSTIDSSGKTLMVPIQLNGHQVNAVVNTASQISLIDQSLAEQIGLVPDGDSTLSIRGVGKGMMIQAKIATDVLIQLGDSTFNWNMNVGPFHELCILGLDFLYHVNATIHLQPPSLEVHDVCIPAELHTVS
jgi:hypothetical protein